MTPRRSHRLIAALCVAALAAGCAGGPHLPSMPHFGGHDKAAKSKYKGSGARISVLGPGDVLATSPSLKGVDFFLPDATPVTNWALPGGTPEQSVEHPDAGRDFVIAWRRNFGQSSNRTFHVTAPPVADGGRIFVMDGAASVSAFDLNDGHEIWRANLALRNRREHDAFGGGIAVDGGKVYVASGYRFVAALDEQTGKVAWRTDTESPMHSAPTIGDGMVIVQSVDDNLLTFDAATGQPGWSHPALVETARILGASSPAVTGDAIIAGFASGELVALQAANGDQLWDDQLSKSNRNSALSEIRDIAGRPVVYRGDVYAVSHSGVMAAVELRSGTVRWTLPVTATTTPLPVGDVVYATDVSGQVVCASRENGQIYWITDLNAGKKTKDRADWSGPILAGPNLVLVSSKGEAVGLNPKTGAVQRSLKIGSDFLMTPIAVGPNLYVATEAAELIAIR